MTEDLKKQLAFIVEIDKVKKIVRQSQLFCDDRRENDAEHSWHICMMTIVLGQYSNEEIDLLKTLKMLLIHDLVEIDAGDKIVYNKTAEDEAIEREAAKRIFGMLPANQAGEYLSLWEEFEERKTPESRFAAAMDRMEPMMMNLYRESGVWEKNGITKEQVLSVNTKIGDGAKELWDWAKPAIEQRFDKRAD